MRRAPLLLAVPLLAAIAVACSTSSSDQGTAPSPDAATPEGTCDPGVTVHNAQCIVATDRVCNVVGTQVTCCPPQTPFVCPATATCYGTAAQAYAACGALPHACFACPAPLDAGASPPDAGSDAGPQDDGAAADAGGDGENAADAGTSDAGSDAGDAGAADASADAADAAG